MIHHPNHDEGKEEKKDEEVKDGEGEGGKSGRRVQY